MPMNRKTIVITSLLAVLVIIFLLASACTSAPVPQHTQTVIPPPLTPPVTLPVRPSVSPAGTLVVANDSTVQGIVPPPAIICNCPMEPAESPTVTPAPVPDDGLCHCP